MSGMVCKEGVSRKRLRLVFVRAPHPPVTLIRNGSDCFSVLDREPHVVDACGAFSVVDSHNPHTPNTHTIHVAADSAGCRPSGACPGPSASQSANCLSSVHSEENPTILASSADRLSSSSWIHTVHCCLPRLVLSFLKVLRQAMPIQMEMEAPTLPTLSLLFNSKAHSCFFRQRVGVIILSSEITHVVGVHGGPACGGNSTSL